MSQCTQGRESAWGNQDVVCWVFFVCFVFKTGFVELAFDSQGSVVYAFALGHRYFYMLIKSCTCKILKVLVLYYGHSETVFSHSSAVFSDLGWNSSKQLSPKSAHEQEKSKHTVISFKCLLSFTGTLIFQKTTTSSTFFTIRIGSVLKLFLLHCFFPHA